MIRSFQVQITGITPVIINRFHEEAAEEATSSMRSARKERPAPQEDAASRLYQNGNGPFLPAENVRQSIIEAAKRFKLGRRAATTDVAAAVFISPFELPLEGEWHVDSRAVVIPATGGRILRHRPMFDEWSVKFQLQIDTDTGIDEKLIKEVLGSAGKLVGIGDFRPARKGPYGRFSIDSWEQE
ncbi:MAG TPA: hypothetical protein VHV10_16350 [Ktedonobacteraceae bacterium]|jgi:hypothetical protein|nr:hypothetical protein [Ktedonobacteraceae bacterium]